MDFIPKIVLGTYGIFTLASLIIIIFLILRRLKIKKKENFEKRDN